MNLNNESIKKIRGLILFTALIVIGLWKYEIVLDAVHFLFSIAFPFILGGAIAFILNVPMNLWRKYFSPINGQRITRLCRKSRNRVV